MSARERLPSIGSGLLATIATIVFAEVLAHTSIHTPNLSVVLLVTVLYATFADGLRHGVVAATLSISFYSFYVSRPGAPFHYVSDDLERLLTTSGAMVLGVALVGHLRQRVQRLLSRERVLQAEAQATSARMLELLESITDGFVAVDREWRYTYVNLKAEELIRMPRASLLGKTIWEAFPLLVGSRWEHEYRRALQNGTTVHFEEYYAPFDAWFETRAYPSPAGLTIYLTDITTRRRAEAALASRLSQQATIAALGLAALRADDTSKVLDEAVRRIARELDVELTKVLELRPNEQAFVLRSGVGWNEGALDSRVDAGSGSQAGYTLVTEGPVIVEDLRNESRFRGPPLLLEHGVVSGMSVVIEGEQRPFGVLGVHTRAPRRFTGDDVAFLQAAANVIAHAMQRHRATVELAASEARFRLLAETVHDAFFITDLETGRDEYVSPAYERIWGQAYDPRGPHWSETVHPDDRGGLATPIHVALADQEYRIVRADGSVRWIASAGVPVRAGRDEPVRRIVRTVRDITDRKDAEENALRLQQEQLARATAEAGLRARDDVLALVSHDLRSPLNTIVMSVELLKERATDQASLKRLGSIGRAAVRMSRLVDDLLDVARIEAGKMSLRIETVDVAALFDDALEVLEVQALEKGVRLELHGRSGLPLVAADRDRMLRVVLNLVGNAIKFTPPGGLVVLGAELSDGVVVVSVSDTGPGISDRDRPQLFRPFWQANASDGRGAGLGLSIARGIVEAHQGQIWLSDAAHGGAQFSFSLRPAVRGSQVS
jgi:PAS domain S-box-containing protein